MNSLFILTCVSFARMELRKKKYKDCDSTLKGIEMILLGNKQPWENIKA